MFSSAEYTNPDCVVEPEKESFLTTRSPSPSRVEPEMEFFLATRTPSPSRVEPEKESFLRARDPFPSGSESSSLSTIESKAGTEWPKQEVVSSGGGAVACSTSFPVSAVGSEMRNNDDFVMFPELHHNIIVNNVFFFSYKAHNDFIVCIFIGMFFWVKYALLLYSTEM